MKNNKMDNNMSAIVSVIMVALGFMNGLSVASLFSSSKTATLTDIINEGLERQYNLELKIEKLEEELVKERQDKEDLLSQLQNLVGKHISLPPPERPIKRSRCCEEYETEEDDECCPISPDLN